MAENPALPIWTDAYLADTHPGLSLESHGCYFLMMMLAWRLPGCQLPDDDHYIAARLGISESRWKKKFRPEMEKFWQVSGGQWTQKRLTREHKYLQSKKQQASDAGKASARKRKEIASTVVNYPLQRDANDIGNEIATALGTNEKATPTPTPTPIKEKYKKEFVEWYEAFPLHKSRGRAEKAYMTARKKASAETLLEAAVLYAGQRAGKDPQYTRHPATWLNGESWLDDAPVENGNAPEIRDPEDDAADERKAHLRMFIKHGGMWQPGWEGGIPADKAAAEAELDWPAAAQTASTSVSQPESEQASEMPDTPPALDRRKEAGR